MFPQAIDFLAQLQAIKDKILEIKASGKDASTIEAVVIWGQYFNLLAQIQDQKETEKTTEEILKLSSMVEQIGNFMDFINENIPPLAVKVFGQKEEIWATWEPKAQEYTPAKIFSMVWELNK